LFRLVLYVHVAKGVIMITTQLINPIYWSFEEFEYVMQLLDDRCFALELVRVGTHVVADSIAKDFAIKHNIGIDRMHISMDCGLYVVLISR
jgi:hypothetical protein